MDRPVRKSLPHEMPSWGMDVSGEVFFVTICAQTRVGAPLLHDNTAEQLLEAVRFYHAQEKWWMSLALVMPDHVHFIVRFNGELASTVRAWKHWTGRNIGVRWQRDFFDHRLRGEEAEREKADYILQNPVRASLVDNWRKWPHLWMPGEW